MRITTRSRGNKTPGGFSLIELMFALSVFSFGAMGILSLCYYAVERQGEAVRQGRWYEAAESAFAVFAAECSEDDLLLTRISEKGAWSQDKPAARPLTDQRYFCRIAVEPDKIVAGLYHVHVYVFPSSMRGAALADRITPEEASRAVYVMRTYLSERE